MRARARVDQDAVRQLPTGKADLIVRGLPERVRMFRTRVPAAVETVAQSLTAPSIAGTLHPSTRDGAGLVRDADWSRATAPLTGTSSGQIGPPGSRRPPPKVSGPPNTDPSAVSPIPCQVPAGPSCVSAGTSREDAGERSRRHRLPYVPPVTGRR